MSPRRSGRVLVLGGHGMLGHAVVQHLRASGVPDLAWTSRQHDDRGITFDARHGLRPLERLVAHHGPFRWIVNCIGVLQSLIVEGDPESVARAEQINGAFPRQLAALAAANGARVIHVSTDGVFPPDAGRCTERTTPAPVNVYGWTKLQGEVTADHVLNVRCSIVGPDPNHRRGLWEWLHSQPPGTRISGFTDQLWVGCTTFQVAELCRRLIQESLFEVMAAEGSVHHFCPCAPLSKYLLLTHLVAALGLDLEVHPQASGRPVTRQLDTEYRGLSAVLPKYAPFDVALASGLRRRAAG